PPAASATPSTSRPPSSSTAEVSISTHTKPGRAEFGYAEALEVPRAIFLSSHKAAQKNAAGSPIISDLTGKRRVQYKTERSLSVELQKLCRDHDYTKRFEKALTKILAKKSTGAKKSGRALALKVIRALDDKAKIRRAELVQHLQAQGYSESEVDSI